MSLVPTPASATNSIAFHDYRKGNWTLQETLTLIAAKRLDDDRRSESKAPSSSSSSSQQYRRSAELRWKWIENYCCANGCLRSQNQCNDKWDNLLRDYKKVIHFNSNSHSNSESSSSYWNMDKQQRKDLSLPSNLSFEVFEALTDVLNRRSNNRRVLIPVTLIPQQPQVLQLEAEKEKAVAVAVPLPLVVPAVNAIPTPPVPTMPTQQQQQQKQQQEMNRPSSACEISESSEPEEDEMTEPDRKRRKVRDAGSGVVQGASIIARTLLACEEKRDKRHRDLVELQERRIRVEADQAEMNRQGFAGLISAVNSLSNAIHSVGSQNRSDNGQSNGNARDGAALLVLQ